MCQEKNYNYSWYRIKGPQNYDGFIQKIVVGGNPKSHLYQLILEKNYKDNLVQMRNRCTNAETSNAMSDFYQTLFYVTTTCLNSMS